MSRPATVKPAPSATAPKAKSRVTILSADPSTTTLAFCETVEAALGPGVDADVTREPARLGHVVLLRSPRGRTRIFVKDDRAVDAAALAGDVVQACVYLEVRQ